MDNKQLRKRYLSLFLALIMIIGTLPINIFAEVDSSNPDNWENPTPIQSPGGTSTRAVDAPDWEVSDEEAQSDYWQLSGKNRLITVAPADQIKNPTIEYAGSYNLGGREVFRLIYRTNSSANAVWQRLLLKFDKELDQMIDWNNSQTVAYKNPATNRESTDIANTSNGTVRFGSVPRENAGSDHVHGLLLNDAGFKNTVIEAGMHFVLKDPITLKAQGLPTSIDELTARKEPVIQSRITDIKYERVLRLNSKYIQGYSSYTSSTVIPGKNYRLELNHEGENKTRTAASRFLSQTSFIAYNKEKGWVDLTLRHHKKDFTGLESTIGLRTVIEDKFFDALQGASYTDKNGNAVAEDKEATIADIFILNSGENPWEGTYDNPTSNRKVSFKRNEINKVKGTNLNYIQAVGGTYKKLYPEEKIAMNANGKAFDTIVNGAVRTGSIGYSTVIRFYVNKDKFEKLMQGQDLLDMTYYTVFTNQADKAKDVFEGTVKEDITIKPGNYDTWPVIATPVKEFAGTATLPKSKKNMILEIGKRPHSITYASDSTQNTTVFWGANDYFWFKTPYEMTLKAGTPIRLTMEDVDNNFNEITIFDTLKDKNAGAKGNYIVKLQRQDQKDGSMEFIRNSYNLKRPTVGVTQNEASIPEIFTTDKVLYGHTRAGNAIVRVSGVGEDDSLLRQAYLTAANDTYKDSGDDAVIDVKNSQAVIVNKKLYNGYEFSTDTAVNEKDPLGANTGVENKKYKTVKDAPIAFTTEDYTLNSLEKLPPIIEQVQAKVTFDLNGGYLGEDAKDDKAKKPIVKIAPLNENYRYVVDKETNFPTATLNTNYKANAFEGPNRRMVYPLIKDNSGKLVPDKTQNPVMASHTDQPLGTEIYKTVFDKFEARLKQRLEDAKNNTETNSTVKASEIQEAEQDLASFKDYIDRFYTSEDIDITKSQLWLREFPGKESQEELKIGDPKAEGKNFLGWSTKKLTTNEEIKDFGKAEVLTKVDDWTAVDNYTKVFKFTENSPIDKERTVYAVYGSGFTIRLHRNSAANDTVVEDILVTKEMFDQDGGKIKLPIAYDNKNNQLTEFKLPKKTFVGWKYSDTDLDYKAYYSDINYNAGVKDPSGKNHIKEITYAQAQEAKRRILDGTIIDFSAEGFDVLNGKTLDLYGLYTDYLQLKAEKKFEGDGIDATSAPTVRVGLLYRTAVTDYIQPTIADNAAYFVPEEATAEHDLAAYQRGSWTTSGVPKDAFLKVYSKESPTQSTDLEWEVRGYDENGDRLSYVLVELGNSNASPVVNADAYYNFNQKWSSLGITVKPSNVDAALTGKTQVFTTNAKGSNKIDAFSAATVRTPEHLNQQDKVNSPLKSYNYVLTNTKLKFQDPVIFNITEGDTNFKLINTVNDGINFITVDINGTEYKIKKTGTLNWDQKLADGETKKFDVDYSTRTKELTITYADGTKFKANDTVRVQYNYGAENSKDALSNWAEKVVEAKAVAGKVTDIKQEPNIKSDTSNPDAEYDTVVITGTRPSFGTELPAAGTKYVLVDGDGNAIKEVLFDQSSTTVRFEVPKKDLDETKEYKIKSIEPGKTDSVSDSSVKLDLTAPSLENMEAKDGGYGMFIDIKGNIKCQDLAATEGIKLKVADTEYPVVAEKVKFVEKDTSTGEEKEVTDPKSPLEEGKERYYILSFINQVPRPSDSKDNNPEIKIIVKDKFNNEVRQGVAYTYVDKTPSFTLIQPKANRSYLQLTKYDCDVIKYEVKRRGTNGLETVLSGQKAPAQNDMRIELKQGEELFKLQKGDLVILTATRGTVEAPSKTFRVR